eukprot:gene2531-3134_t
MKAAEEGTDELNNNNIFTTVPTNSNHYDNTSRHFTTDCDKNDNNNNNVNQNNNDITSTTTNSPNNHDSKRFLSGQPFMTPSEILLTKVTFKLEVQKSYLKANEVVSLIGDSNEIGNWSVKGAVELQHTESNETNNIWTCSVLFPTSSTVSYKYIIINKLHKPVHLVEWEAARGSSRSIYVEGIDMFVNDGQFGIIGSASKPWVGRGWLPDNEFQLRVQLQVDEKPVILHDTMIEESEIILRLHDPFGLSQDFQLPILTFTELVLHAPSIPQLGFNASILKKSSVENGASSPRQDHQLIGKCFIISSQVQKRWGKIYSPILSEKGVIGEFRFNYILVTPFAHPHNSLSVLWRAFVEQPNSLIGHRGNGKNNFGINTSAVTENTVLSFLTAARFGAKMIEFDLQLTFDGVPVIFHDYEIEIETSEGVVMKETINRLTLDQFLKLKPQKKNDPLTNAMSRMKKNSRISRSTGDLLALCGHNNNIINNNNNNSSILSTLNNNGNINNNNIGASGIINNQLFDASTSSYSNIIHDRFSTFQEAFTLVPSDVGFMIEIKYPNLLMQNMRKFKAPERNEFVDIILNIVFNEAGDRRIAFLTFDPDIAILLRTKQFRYPVLFLVCSDTPSFFSVFDPDVNVNDTRGNSIRNAVSFVKSVNLDGIVCDSESILSNHSFVNLIHSENLLLFTYGSKNVDAHNVKIQTDLGVDGIIADNVTKLSKKLKETPIPAFLK